MPQSCWSTDVAIAHLAFKIFSRSHGANAVLKAAYRAGATLHDERLGLTYNYESKTEAVRDGILAPADAPAWVRDREKLWNHIESIEKRRDAQLAREFTVALPIELTLDQQHALLVGYLEREFVSHGMVADYNIHAKEGNPHAHVMLSLRSVDKDGFGLKERSWNAQALLKHWRQSWEEHANDALARAGRLERIDMRSYAEQGIALTPAPKRFRSRQEAGTDKRDHVQGQLDREDSVRRQNGEKVLARPELILDHLTSRQSVFTEHDLLRAVHRFTTDEQFDAARIAVMGSQELVNLHADVEHGRYTTRSVLALEHALVSDADHLQGRARHRLSPKSVDAAIHSAAHTLSEEQAEAVRHVAQASDIAVVQGIAGTGKSTMLSAARTAWETEGYIVVGAALAGKAVEGLSEGTGMPARTLASWERAWSDSRSTLSDKHVLVIDEAGMVGTRQMQTVLAHARRAGAKVVLVGDSAQLAAIDPGSPMRLFEQRYGAARLEGVVRQKVEWQRQATKLFGQHRAIEALALYQEHNHLIRHNTQDRATEAVVARWAKQRAQTPNESTIMVAFRRADVLALNTLARAHRRAKGELGQDVAIVTNDGRTEVAREFAAGDQIAFLRNERSLGVTNGTIGTVEGIEGSVVEVRLAGGQRVSVDTAHYNHFTHGYATTIHKSQGVTVDHAFVLASKAMNAAATYVALSRHRQSVELHWSNEQFFRSELFAELSRDDAQPMASELLEEADGTGPGTARAMGDLSTASTETLHAALERIGPLAKQAPKTIEEAFAHLPEVVAAKAKHAEADKLCAGLHAKLREAGSAAKDAGTGERETLTRALVRAQVDLLRAEEHLELTLESIDLRAIAEEAAREHNTRIAHAKRYCASVEHQLACAARDEQLAEFVATVNRKHAHLSYRLPTAGDQQKRFIVAAEQKVGAKSIFILRSPSTANEYVVVDGRHFASSPARGTSIVLSTVKRADGEHAVEPTQEIQRVAASASDRSELSTDAVQNRDGREVRAHIESAILAAGTTLHQRTGHRVSEAILAQVLEEQAQRTPSASLSSEQRDAVRHLVSGGDLALFQGYAGTGKSSTLRTAREAWERQGYKVIGGALAGKAADGLQGGAAIASRTLASWESAWTHGKHPLTRDHVFVIDEAGLIGARQMQRILAQAKAAGAKVVLTGDTAQLAAIDPGSPMRLLQEHFEAAALTTVVRQHIEWQRTATQLFGEQRTNEALSLYREHGLLHAQPSSAQAARGVVDRWHADANANPADSRIMLAYRRTDVDALNELARGIARKQGKLGKDHIFRTDNGRVLRKLAFATGDQIVFLKNASSIGVANGTIGTITELRGSRVTAALPGGQVISFDAIDYKHIDYGYATTIHKSQGMTTDRTFVLASSAMDAAATYVALSRHRKHVELHYDEQEFLRSDIAERLSRQGSRLPEEIADGIVADHGECSAFTLRAISNLSPQEVKMVHAHLRRRAERQEISAEAVFRAMPTVQEVREAQAEAEQAQVAAKEALASLAPNESQEARERLVAAVGTTELAIQKAKARLCALRVNAKLLEAVRRSARKENERIRAARSGLANLLRLGSRPTPEKGVTRPHAERPPHSDY
jgi:Ti-type conjugative transfer relaxase TraA